MEETYNDVRLCTHCGQTLLFDGAECNCQGAVMERDKATARRNIIQAFGPPCEENGLTPCTEAQKSELIRLANLALDGEIVDATLNLGGATKAKISLNAKGKCVISRNNSRVIKLEG